MKKKEKVPAPFWKVKTSALVRKPDAYQVDGEGRANVTIGTLLKSKSFQDAVARARKAHDRQEVSALR